MSSLIHSHARGFWRLVWKEFRQYRAVILSLLAAGLLLQLGALAVAQYGTLPVLLSAGVIPIMCGLAIAATTFAGEHDNGTFLGLRALPATQLQIVWAKLLVAIGGAAASYLLLWLVVYLLRGQLIGPSQWVLSAGELGDWLVGSLTTLLEILVVGVWMSLRERRALVALIKSILIVAAVRLVTGLVAYGIFSGRFDDPATTDWAIVATSTALRGVALLGVVGLVIRNSARWYGDDTTLGLVGFGQTWGLADVGQRTIREPVRPGHWRRLGWLQAKYGGWVALSILGLVAALWMADIFYGPRFSLYSPTAAIAAMVGIVVLGAMTFRGANAHRPFLAALGCPPRRIWFSQLLLPLAAVLALLAMAFLMLLAGGGGHRNPQDFAREMPFTMVLPFAICFAWAQLVSQQSRSAITSIAKSVLAAAVILLVVGLFRPPQFAPGWLLALDLPLLVYPFVESYARAPAWLSGLEIARWRWPFVRCGLAVLLAGTLLTRYVREIPYCTNAQLATALNGGVPPETTHYRGIREVAERVEQHRQAAFAQFAADRRYLYDVQDDQQRANVLRAWVESSRPELEAALSLPFENLSAQFWALQPDNQDGDQEAGRVGANKEKLRALLAAALVHAVNEGDVDLAERIILKSPVDANPVQVARWAWLSENDPQRIRQTIRQMESNFRTLEATVADLGVLMPTSAQQSIESRPDPPLMERLTRVVVNPRENRRARAFAMELPESLRYLDGRLAAGIPMYRVLFDSMRLMPSFTDSDFFRDYFRIVRFANHAMTERALVLQLAAIAWAREHEGELPPSLEVLVGDYLTRSLLDPWTGKPFVYERERPVKLAAEAIYPGPGGNLVAAAFIFSPDQSGATRLLGLLGLWRQVPASQGRRVEPKWWYDNELYWFGLEGDLTGMSRTKGLVWPFQPNQRLDSLFPLKLADPAAANEQR